MNNTTDIKNVSELIVEKEDAPVYDAKGKPITGVKTDLEDDKSAVNVSEISRPKWCKSEEYEFQLKGILDVWFTLLPDVNLSDEYGFVTVLKKESGQVTLWNFTDSTYKVAHTLTAAELTGVQTLEMDNDGWPKTAKATIVIDMDAISVETVVNTMSAVNRVTVSKTPLTNNQKIIKAEQSKIESDLALENDRLSRMLLSEVIQVVGGIIRDENDIITKANIVWPDNSNGVITFADFNSDALAYDSYVITHIDSNSSVNQAKVTRDTSGNVTEKPILTINTL